MTTPAPDGAARTAILTVDDDPGVSRSIARDLRHRYGEQHRIVRAESGAAALDALKEMRLRGDEVAVILADYRMPQMNGIEFLEEDDELSPPAGSSSPPRRTPTPRSRPWTSFGLGDYLVEPSNPRERSCTSDRRPAGRGTWRPRSRAHDQDRRGTLMSPLREKIHKVLARDKVASARFSSDEPNQGQLSPGKVQTAAALPLIVTRGQEGHRHPERARSLSGHQVGLDAHAGQGLLRGPRRDQQRPRPGSARAVYARVQEDSRPSAWSTSSTTSRQAGQETPDQELPRVPGAGSRRPASRAAPG